MPTTRARTALLLLVVGAALAACEGTSTLLPDPNDPSTNPVTKTKTYDGSITVGGSNVHPLTVGAGAVTATLTAVAPLATASLGMALGQWDGTNCTVVTTTDEAKIGTSLTATAYAPVNACLRVFDAGNIPEGTTYTYTATVVHY